MSADAQGFTINRFHQGSRQWGSLNGNRLSRLEIQRVVNKRMRPSLYTNILHMTDCPSHNKMYKSHTHISIRLQAAISTFRTAVILSAAKDLRAVRPEILRCAQDDSQKAQQF